MNILNQQQIDQYHERGYCAPIDIMSEQQARELRNQLEYCEHHYPEQIHAEKRNNTHHIFKFMDEIIFHPGIVGAVQDILGPDLLLFGTVLFIKEPQSSGYVSWHQDATYMGLEPHEFITPWLALTHSNETNGCMSVIPGSHLNPIQQHHDTFGENNILTRGQEIQEVDEQKAVDIILRPGQLSLHHPRLIHGSKPNLSNERRIGVALQSYMTPDIKQTIGTGYAIQISGDDPFGHFRLAPRPQKDMESHAIQWRDQVEADWSKILYAGASQKRRY